MKFTKFHSVVILIFIAVLSATAANATIFGTVNIQSHNNTLSDSGTLYGDGYPGGIYAYTGIYSWTNAGGTDLGTQVPNWGFCIEMPQVPYNGWMNVLSMAEAPLDDTPPMGITKANYIRELWGRDFDPSWITGANRQMAEAFSAAIMEII